MSKAHAPELKRFMDKKLTLRLSTNQKITGILRGFDPFMNLVVDEAFEIPKDASSSNVPLGMVVIRGNSVITIDAEERIL